MLIKFFAIFVASLLLATKFSYALPPSSRIVNGVLVEPGEFPYVVSLQLNDKHICGGVIYNDLFVLTAASCVKNIIDVTDLFVNVADLDFLDDEEVDQEAYSVIDIQLAPDDDGNSGPDDLAVIHLSRPLVFGPNVNCVRVGEVEPTGSSKGVIIGHGASGSGGLPSNRCRKGDVTLAGSCPNNNWPNYLESYMICAGTAEDVNKPCDFDYGSPLVQDGVAVGILSQQNNCQSSPYDSSIYIRLASYYYWIREEANTQPSNCFKSTAATSSTQTTRDGEPESTTTALPTSTPTTRPSTVTATTPTVPDGYVCPTDNGFFPIDPNKCLPNYYVCVNGAPNFGTCPPGSLFDPAQLYCVPEDEASCNFQCPTANGFYPVFGQENNQCFNGYITCVSFIAYPQLCPPKSVFDPEDGFCVPASSNGCSETNTTPGTSITLKPVDPDNLCCPGVGQYPLSGSCTQYVICGNDLEPTITSCRVGQVFNPYSGLCDDPANVPGCNFYSITDYIQGLKIVGIKSSRAQC